MVDVLIIGTGEYTTGFVSSMKATQSDKTCGVVALVSLDLRRRGKVSTVSLCGRSGMKLAAIRRHLNEQITSVYSNLAVCAEEKLIDETFPDDENSFDEYAYRYAIGQMKQGGCVFIFTPDNTHFDIAMAAIHRGLHVLIAKPAVMTLEHHHKIVAAAAKHRVVVAVEVHKRYDPMYSDARNRIRTLGDFGYFTSYMSQPKFQLDTFAAWAGKSSDISYYLNAHHVDFHCWCLIGLAVPVRVSAVASHGVGQKRLKRRVEDTICLTVEWRNLASGNVGIATYTASWSAPNKSDVHSQQRFFYQGHGGEISIDQAHRGYTSATDTDGFSNVNPLFMRYTPDEHGRFVGQSGYGYQSFERFVDEVTMFRQGKQSLDECIAHLPSARMTVAVTAVLEAGRRSLDSSGMPMLLTYATAEDEAAQIVASIHTAFTTSSSNSSSSSSSS